VHQLGIKILYCRKRGLQSYYLGSGHAPWNLQTKNRSFREEVRGFLREQLSPDISDKVLKGSSGGRGRIPAWQRRLHQRAGRMGGRWEFGGTGRNSVQQYFREESALAGGPRLIPIRHKRWSRGHMAFGAWPNNSDSAEDQRRGGLVVPGISEPGRGGGVGGGGLGGCGPDLASLRSSPTRRGSLHRQRPENLEYRFLVNRPNGLLSVRTDPQAKQTIRHHLL